MIFMIAYMYAAHSFRWALIVNDVDIQSSSDLSNSVIFSFRKTFSPDRFLMSAVYEWLSVSLPCLDNPHWVEWPWNHYIEDRAIQSSVCLFAHTIHPFACLLLTLFALIRSLTSLYLIPILYVCAFICFKVHSLSPNWISSLFPGLASFKLSTKR